MTLGNPGVRISGYTEAENTMVHESHCQVLQELSTGLGSSS